MAAKDILSQYSTEQLLTGREVAESPGVKAAITKELRERGVAIPGTGGTGKLEAFMTQVVAAQAELANGENGDGENGETPAEQVEEAVEAE